MSGPAAGGAHASANSAPGGVGAARCGPLCLGWEYAPALADPGPAPDRPALAPTARFDPGWMEAQRGIARVLARPALAGVAAGVLAAAVIAAASLAGFLPADLGWAGTLAAAAGSLYCAASLRRGRRRLGAVIAAELRRVRAAEAAQARRLAAGQREHASDYRTWQRRKAIFDRQPAWFAVPLPAGIDRIDVAGGTLAGWSALLTTIGAPHLSHGGELTVADLSEGAVGGDLVNLARRSGLRPLVWVLPGDLPRLDLGTGLEPGALADVLALAGSAAEAGRAGERGPDPVADCALLERVLGVLGPEPRIASVTAALRALAQIGDPRSDAASGLITSAQLELVGTLFGRGASERLIIERAFVLESRLRRLDALGTAGVRLAPSRLRIASLDRRAGAIGNRMVGTYLVAAMTHMLRQAPPGEPWAHVLCLLGAERLGGDVLDRLADACETSRTGLVLAYRSIPAGVRERLGRGNAVTVFMRLGNGEDARVASDLIGTEHRFIVGQLTDSVGTSVTDTWADSYTSTVGTADSVADSVSASQNLGSSSGRGRSSQSGFAPFGDFSRSASRDSNYSAGESSSVSLTAGINSGTSWGVSLSRALGENASLGRTVQRSREFLVEPDELQRLPPSAMIVSYPAPVGRSVVLADANPAIMTLPGVSALGSAGDDDDE